MKADSLSYAPSLGTLLEIKFQIQIFDIWTELSLKNQSPFPLNNKLCFNIEKVGLKRLNMQLFKMLTLFLEEYI